MKAKKQSKQEDISTDWELNEGWGADMITDWNIDLPEWDIQIPDWDSLLSEGWNNTTDKTDKTS